MTNMDESIVEQVIESIADAEDIDPFELEITLSNHVSVDAIQELVTHKSNAWRLQFETPKHVVEVTGNDEILVDSDQY